MARWKHEKPSGHAAYMREWMKTKAGKEYRRKRLSAGYTKKWRKANPERYKTMKKAAELKVKTEAMIHYSNADPPRCVCCGETEIMFLSLDHIKDDGYIQKRKDSHDGKNRIAGYYYWLKRNNYPAGLQTLCMNCNFGKRLNGGTCPHKANQEN